MSKQIISKTKNTGSSAQKVRLVADLIRGKNALQSAEMLTFVNKQAAKHVKKCLDSAIANAKVMGYNADSLQVATIFVDEGATGKRFKPSSRGRMKQIYRRTSHITIVLK
jgi:large subunit ribosomal protein L22